MSDQQSAGIAPVRGGVVRLPEHLANQIAAGEVVQRPESVVKELVENAIDAGATHVTVIIAGAGKNLLQVIDDGTGMGEDDALLAFERHATSKIHTLADLEQIVTFGFRGEALPSIASVSKVEMKTRRAEDDLAVVLRIEGGRIDERTRDSAPVGTSIAVRNLFFNTPARRQFLKADSTEYRHITDTVQRYILSYPHLRITYISEQQTIYDAMPGTLHDRVMYLFGDRVAGSLIDVTQETDVMTVAGFVGRPNFAKRTRGDQYLFVNGRYITSRLMNHAVVSAYDNMLEQGVFPFYILFLNLDPRGIDVNVHPQKLEVKFSNERAVHTFLNAVVRQSLHRFDLAPSIAFRDEAGAGFGGADEGAARTRLTAPEDAANVHTLRFDAGANAPSNWERATWESAPRTRDSGQRLDSRAINDLFRTISPQESAASQGGTRAEADDHTRTVLLPSERPVSDTQFLWQLHNKYIFTPIKTGLMIIDQHVAHERILYERGLAALDHAAPFSQQLLFPHAFRVNAGDLALLKDISGELRHLGFVIRLEPPNFVSVEAVPQDVRVGMEESILEEMLEQYKEYAGLGMTDVRHAVAASYGCRAAIKAGDKMSAPEMQSLIDQLFATSNPYTCPHGRPIIIKLSLDELDRRFGRTS
jgi:DNA mismatch repair protein MutL